MGEETTA